MDGCYSCHAQLVARSVFICRLHVVGHTSEPLTAVRVGYISFDIKDGFTRYPGCDVGQEGSQPHGQLQDAQRQPAPNFQLYRA